MPYSVLEQFVLCVEVVCLGIPVTRLPTFLDRLGLRVLAKCTFSPSLEGMCLDMKPIKWALIAVLIFFSSLWWITEQPDWVGLNGVFGVRPVLLQYTGILAISVMSFAMILANRPVWLEPYLGGLDKMYRLHKWLGITALTLATTHWLWVNAPKWLVDMGLLVRPPRGPKPPLEPGSWQQLLQSQRDLAEGIGEWTFYAIVAILLIALVKRFSYRIFTKTHILMAVAYLALVFHAVILIKFDYWGEVLGVIMAALLLAGTISALRILFGRVGADRRTSGKVVGITPNPVMGTVALDIKLNGGWKGHEAGQFAFLTLNKVEGPHPFTITSAWQQDNAIQFIIKGLGDYTQTLANSVQVGDVVTVEGPYGCFTFQSSNKRQIWVGGGIGITPFISRLKTLAQQTDGKTIDLFHSTATYDEQALGLLERDANKAHVNLHVLWSQRDGYLTAERIIKQIPQWRDADIWFCGPSGFGEALKRDFMALGLPADAFHQELFEMR